MYLLVLFAIFFQEYPPGVTVVPMKSGTLKPFSTTNLVAILPKDPFSGPCNSDSSILHADALIMDPGCKLHTEVRWSLAYMSLQIQVFHVKAVTIASLLKT